jgi:hypothetical protein
MEMNTRSAVLLLYSSIELQAASDQPTLSGRSSLISLLSQFA